jgi:hypothetical protein
MTREEIVALLQINLHDHKGDFYTAADSLIAGFRKSEENSIKMPCEETSPCPYNKIHGKVPCYQAEVGGGINRYACPYNNRESNYPQPTPAPDGQVKATEEPLAKDKNK